MKVVDEQMDGVAGDQRKKLQTIEKELADVRRRLDTIYNLVETTEVEMADFTPRIRQHRERQERLEFSADQARAALAQRRNVLDDVNTIAAYAQDMSAFLKESELTERRTFIESFVKEVIVMPDNALMRYTVPMPEDSFLAGGVTEKVALNGSVLASMPVGGAGGIRIVVHLSCIVLSPQDFSHIFTHQRSMPRAILWSVIKTQPFSPRYTRAVFGTSLAESEFGASCSSSPRKWA